MDLIMCGNVFENFKNNKNVLEKSIQDIVRGVWLRGRAPVYDFSIRRAWTVPIFDLDTETTNSLEKYYHNKFLVNFSIPVCLASLLKPCEQIIINFKKKEKKRKEV